MKSNFEKHLEGTVELFKVIIKNGFNDDSEECELIKDELDDTWYELTDSEQDLIRDLYEVFYRIINHES